MSEQTAQKDRDTNSALADEDLSRRIEGFVNREPLDLVRCVRVFGIYYRCNWWSLSTAAGRTLEYSSPATRADYIRKSRFLCATLNAGDLVVKEIDPVHAHQRSVVREA